MNIHLSYIGGTSYVGMAQTLHMFATTKILKTIYISLHLGSESQQTRAEVRACVRLVNV